MYAKWKEFCLFVCMSICCFCPRGVISTKSFRIDSEESLLLHHTSQDSVDSEEHSDPTTHIFKEYAAGLSSRTDLVKKERVVHDHIHEVVFAVQQKNVPELTRMLHEVSDPDSHRYGQHRSRIEIEEIASNPTSRNYVLQYLQDSGATIISESIFGEYITAQAPVSLWEKMFKTEFYKFHHTSEERKNVVELVRAEMYSVPSTLHEHVASVFQTIQMTQTTWGRPILHRLKNSTSVVQSHAVLGSIQPKKLHVYYSMDNNTGNSLSSQAVFQSLNQFVSPRDLTLFQTAFQLPKQGVTTFIGGGNDDFICTIFPETCAEGNLDMQYLMAISQGVPTTNWYTDFSDFSNWLLAVANKVNPPLVISLSYGTAESFVSASEFDAFNLQAIKLGLMGVTILVSSGDDGVQSYQTRNKDICGYFTLFPASSPYVTSVGATQGPESLRPERTCQSDLGGIITSGGGFSTYYPRPAWQSADVAGYFSKMVGTPSAPVPGYSTTGRGYPDLSLAGTAYKVIIGGQWFSASGTSASTPVLAGMVALINAARLDANMSSVGWLNPTLYKRGKSFVIDVLLGKNNCGVGLRIPCCSEGFSATTGWDPTTGLGSVNFTLFKREMMNILPAELSPSASPTAVRTELPSKVTAAPTSGASRKPATPIAPPTVVTRTPTVMTASQTRVPTKSTAKPTAFATKVTRVPTRTPTSRRSLNPTSIPTIRKTSRPTSFPTQIPAQRSLRPTVRPSTYKPSMRKRLKTINEL